MTINGSLSITTYFILNKRDRSGKSMQRPFNTVLEEMKRQDTERAKIKQSSSLKGGSEPNQAAATAPPMVTITENEAPRLPAPMRESVQMSVPMKTTESDENGSSLDHRTSTVQTRVSNDPSVKTFQTINEQNDPTVIFGRQSRSKTCDLL